MKRIILTVTLILFSLNSFGWDSKGHALVANVGAHLMENKSWRDFLVSQADLLGTAAGFPDDPFRKQSTELVGIEAEAPNHYFHIDDENLKTQLPKVRKMKCEEAVPFLAAHFAGPNALRLPTADGDELNRARSSTVGLSPWRIEQFVRKARSEIVKAQKTKGLGQSTEIRTAAYDLGIAVHMVGDHSVPWHALTDSHGEKSGHSNIHIFLEHCADSLLDPQSTTYDKEFATEVSHKAIELRRQWKNKFKGKSIVEFSIMELEESAPHAKEIEALDTAEVFVSEKLPPVGTAKDAPSAARKASMCRRFRTILVDRLSTAAASASWFFDLAIEGIKAPSQMNIPTAAEIQVFRERPYSWFACEK